MGAVFTLSNDQVAKYNPRTKFFDRIKLGNGKSYFDDFALDRHTDILFISDSANNTIYAYDTRHNVPNAIKTVRAPTRLETCQDSPWLFVVSEISQILSLVNYKSIFVLEPGSNKVVSTLPSARNPVMFIVSPDCRALYIVDKAGDSEASALYRIDVSNKKIDGSLSLNGSAGGIGISPDAGTVYVSTAREGILVIRANGLNVESTIQLQDGTGRRLKPGEIVVTPDGKKLYATTDSNTIAVVDLEARVLLKLIETKFKARTLAMDPAENMLYVVCYLVDILVIDMATDNIAKRMTIGPGEIKKIAISRQ